jgi:hypothetical protein
MPSFAQQMITKLQAVLLESAGLAEAVIDGVSVKLTDVEAKLRYWENRRAQECGAKPRVSSIDLRRT